MCPVVEVRKVRRRNALSLPLSFPSLTFFPSLSFPSLTFCLSFLSRSGLTARKTISAFSRLWAWLLTFQGQKHNIDWTTEEHFGLYWSKSDHFAWRTHKQNNRQTHISVAPKNSTSMPVLITGERGNKQTNWSTKNPRKIITKFANVLQSGGLVSVVYCGRYLWKSEQ